MTEDRHPLGPLFRSYRGACPEPDASVSFMPRLWEKIEARRTWVWQLRSYSRGLVTVVATVCLALLAFELSPLSSTHPIYVKSYLEALDEDSSPETLTYLDVVASVDFDGHLQ